MHDDEAESHASAAKAESDGRNLFEAGLGAESRTAAVGLPKPEASRLMEAVVERNNLFRAYERVVKNAGAPGVDGLSVSEFKPWLQRHWVRVRQDLLTGVYQPEVARKVEDERVLKLNRSVVAVEAGLCTGQEPDAGRIKRRARVAVSHQWARPVVEWRCLVHECRLSEVLVRPYGTGFVAGIEATPYLCFMNRRMPNGTSCGVGGRRE